MELCLPAIAALLYAIGAHLLKNAMSIGPWRVTFICNISMAFIYAPLMLFASAPPGPDATFYQPLVAGSFFFLGQVFTFLAIRQGDVSIATPVMGTKIIFVTALVAILSREQISSGTWIAASLGTMAVALLGISRPGERAKVGYTIALASASSLFFALTDVLVQLWAPNWGALNFIPYMFAACAALSLLLIPCFSAPLTAISLATWKQLAPGCLFITLQALAMALMLSLFGRAPEANIIYSSRGIWAILIVLFAARFLHSDERLVSRGTLFLRLLGSLLLMAAIVLVAIQ